MLTSIVTGGLLGQGLAIGGFVQGANIAITTFADPRQGTILFVDTDIAGVDPRQGIILSVDTDLAGVDPRQGAILFPDSDPAGVNPHKGKVIG